MPGIVVPDIAIRVAKIELGVIMPDTLERPPRPRETIEDLLEVDFVRQFCVEISTDCNLACVYCHVAPLARRGSKASPELIEQIYDFVDRFPLGLVSISGEAEITLHKGWVDFAEGLLKRNARLRIISNFSKGVFSEEEADLLSRFKEIVVSMDVADFELLKKTRYRADLRTMTLNIQNVRAAAIRNARPLPEFQVTIVVHDKSIMQIDKTTAFCAANGIKDVLAQLVLEEHEIPGGVNDFMKNPNAIPVESITKLSREQAIEASYACRRAAAIARLHGVKINMNEVLDVLETIIDNSEVVDRATEDMEGRTRMCMMPWDFFYVQWDGATMPCCIIKDETLGSANESSLVDLINNSDRKAWRKGLLTGDMPDVCKTCTFVGSVPIDTFRAKVKDYLTNGGTDL